MLREVLGVTRKPKRSNIFVFYWIFMTNFSNLPSPPPVCAAMLILGESKQLILNNGILFSANQSQNYSRWGISFKWIPSTTLKASQRLISDSKDSFYILKQGGVGTSKIRTSKGQNIESFSGRSECQKWPTYGVWPS